MAAATLVLGTLQVVATGTADNVRLVNLPAGRKWLRIRPRTSACKILIPYGGADDAAIGAAAYADAPADTDFIREISAYGTTIGVASASATVSFEIEVRS